MEQAGLQPWAGTLLSRRAWNLHNNLSVSSGRGKGRNGGKLRVQRGAHAQQARPDLLLHQGGVAAHGDVGCAAGSAVLHFILHFNDCKMK